MKQFFTLLTLLFLGQKITLAQCSVGGNGVASATTITIDGNMSDWTNILNDADNNTYDGSPDLDAPISDVGRDFTRFAFTENATNLFLYFGRAGSANNSIDILFYLDIDNDGRMETNEPVLAMSWSGSNGNASVKIYNYIQAGAGGDVVSSDGGDMPGSLQIRVNLSDMGKGTPTGTALEVAIPFTYLYKQGSSNPADILAPGDQFTFHISSINGSASSVPGSNSINDNFGGCYSGQLILPVHLTYFEGVKSKAGASLTWKVADNEQALTYEIQESADGINFTTIGEVKASQASGSIVYSFFANLSYEKSYFRLKITDKDKQSQYSKAIVISGKNAASGSVLSVKNPVHSDLVVRYVASKQNTALVKLYHSSGAVVYSEKVAMSNGLNVLVVPANFMSLNGCYIVEVVNQYNERVSQKVLKL